MAVTIPRTPWIDDDGTGTTGTIINNAVKTELYNQIDAALAQVAVAGAPTGLWTPTLVGDSGVATYSAQSGSSIVLSGWCLATLNFVLTSKGTLAGSIKIAGWPSPPTAGIATVPITFWGGLVNPTAGLQGYFVGNLMYLQRVPGSGATTSGNNMTVADIADTFTVTTTVVYRAT